MTMNQLSVEEQRIRDLHQWSGSWIWRAVQCIVDAPDFESSPKWIAGRLNISIEKAVDALEGLERLGYINRDGNNLKSSDQWLQVLPGEVSVDEILDGHSKLAPQIISKLRPADKYSSQFFLGNAALVDKFSPRFVQLFREMNDEGIGSNLNDVIACSISFANLTRPSDR